MHDPGYQQLSPGCGPGRCSSRLSRTLCLYNCPCPHNDNIIGAGREQPLNPPQCGTAGIDHSATDKISPVVFTRVSGWQLVSLYRYKAALQTLCGGPTLNPGDGRHHCLAVSPALYHLDLLPVIVLARCLICLAQPPVRVVDDVFSRLRRRENPDPTLDSVKSGHCAEHDFALL